MGVSGLWTLLEPVGKRVNIQTLAGKTLAIDASIWIFQFLNTMRDDEGNFIRNGHLMGFFRRICRLLFNRIRPVFVFDGATPALKRLTVAARRRRRELQAAKVRKTAEKLLMKKLKAHLLEEEKAAREASKAQKAAAAAQRKTEREASRATKAAKKRKRKETAADTGTAPGHPDADDITASEAGVKDGVQAAPRTADPPNGTGQGAGASETKQPAAHSNATLSVDQAAAAAQAVEIADAADVAEAAELAEAAEALQDDVEVQASGQGGSEEESDGELDLDAIMNAGGDLDPTAVGQLPPSLQLEVLTKHREQQAQLNRARFQEASKNAEGFSSLQMSSYIKQTELRRKMEAVRASSARAGSSAAKGHFVLEDHAQDEPTQVKVQLHSAGKGPSEWNRHVMNSAKKAPYGKHRPEAFVPPVSLAGVLPGMPQLIQGLQKPEVLERSSTAAPITPDVSAGVAEVHADTARVTAEELAAALLGGGAGSSDSELAAGEADDLEWEDAGIADVAAHAEQRSVERAGPAEPQRRHMWSRTHGYKFGRKLGDWSGGGGGDAPAAEVSPAQDPLEAAAIRAAAEAAAAEGAPAEVLGQEQRSLQHGILNSLGVHEPDADAAVLHAANGCAAGKAQGAATADAAAHRDAPSAGPGSARPCAAADLSGCVVGPGPDRRACSPAASGGGNGDSMEWEDAVPGSSPANMAAVASAEVGSTSSAAAELAAGEGPHMGVAQASGAGVARGNAAVAMAASPGVKEAARAGLKMSMPKWGRGRGAAGGGARVAHPQQASGTVSDEAALVSSQQGGAFASSHAAEHSVATVQAAPAPPPSAAPTVPPQRDPPGLTSGAPRLRAVGVAAADRAHVGADPDTSGDRPGASSSLPDGDTAAEAGPAGGASGCSTPAAAAPSGSPGAVGIDHGVAGGGPGMLTEEDAELVADAEGLADAEVAAAIAAEELGIADEPAAADAEAVVLVTNEAGPSGKLCGGGSMLPAARRGSSGPVAKAAGGSLDAFLPQNDATDLEKRLRDVMGEVTGAKRSFKKQSGTDDVPTEMMFKECQELLQLFGIPYIIAPTEAEAQCAWLEEQGLVDGVVTDDNDALLFGASHVYRHFFKDKQYCEQYLKPDWERDLGLTKERLALLALLLGSDYTEGISGIGVVNAMETLAAFPSYDELKAFRSWLDSPNLEAFRTVTGKKGRTSTAEEDVQSMYKASHQQACKSWEVPATFPDQKVLDAYAKPSVDTDTAAFTFLKPDLEILRGYCHKVFGWSQDATDSLLVPVLQEYDQRQSQLRLDAFYTMTHRFAKIKSRRLKDAVSTAMGRQIPEEMVLSDILMAEAARTGGRSQVGTSADRTNPADKTTHPGQAEQVAAAVGKASQRKRRCSAGRQPAPAWQDHDVLDSAGDDSDGDYASNVLQGFFY